MIVDEGWRSGSLSAEIAARIANYEMAFNLQASVPDVTNLKDEPDHIFEEYGQEARQPGTYAANCLMARRLAERGVRFIQLYHQDWDHHGSLPSGLRRECKQTDQATAALITDLALPNLKLQYDIYHRQILHFLFS